jgi:hypothetical protein
VVRRGRGRRWWLRRLAEVAAANSGRIAGRSRWSRGLAVRGMRQVTGEKLAVANLGNDDANGERGVTSMHCPSQVAAVRLMDEKHIYLIGLRSLCSSQRCLHEVYHLGCNRRVRNVEPTKTEEVWWSRKNMLSLEKKVKGLRGKKLLLYQLCGSSPPHRPED